MHGILTCKEARDELGPAAADLPHVQSRARKQAGAFLDAVNTTVPVPSRSRL
jgi:hypothetical protein